MNTISSTYEIIKKIGSGGGGTVFLANHLRLGKKVVLKADRRELKVKPEILRREVDVLKNLNHSYIPQVYDFFVEEETTFTVMDYIEGDSLDKLLKRGEKFDQALVIKWAKQLLEALDYLHSPIHGNPPKGYVHSDIKPANIMRTPQNNICMIDFNISLALGEENVVGRSAGYSSPEHYGLDYTYLSDNTIPVDDEKTVTLIDQNATVQLSSSSSSSMTKRIVPDVRSDIYSVGATLYHLLSGRKPAKNACDVVALSDKEISPQIVNIIKKAMNPNPNYRYQSAKEMLEAFKNLRINDIRVKRLKRNNKIVISGLTICLVLGITTAFIGLKRMQTVESWLNLTQHSSSALDDGDVNMAINYALQSLPSNKSLITPDYLPESQKSLTDALGVYDLVDGYKSQSIVELPSNPLYMMIAPNGLTVACIYSKHLAILDLENAKILKTLETDESALSEVEYIDDNKIVFSGLDGISVYDISSDELLWTGKLATGIAVSNDKSKIAAVYRDETSATIYDANSGEELCVVDFNNRHQKVTTNDIFINPNDNLFALNNDGSKLAISFSDGSLVIYDVNNSNDNIVLFDNTSGFNHFEGDFYNEYLSLTATNDSNSLFAVIDTIDKQQEGGFESDTYFSTSVDQEGIIVKTGNILVRIDPVTGNQTPLITTSNVIDRYCTNGIHTIVSSDNTIMVFDETANLVSSFQDDINYDFILMKGELAVLGSQDSTKIKIMKYESHEDKEVFKYDPAYLHDELRVSDDGQTVMLFSYDKFRIYNIGGDVVTDVNIPDANEVYDQQYIRKENESYLEVIYNNGVVLRYDARNGDLISKNQINQPDLSLYEEFETNDYIIKSDLHGAPRVYQKNNAEFICELEANGYLTYVTQLDNGNIVTQYINTEGDCFGILLDSDCQTIAYLPNLKDVYNEQLYFDYVDGTVRKSNIYSLDELVELANQKV